MYSKRRSSFQINDCSAGMADDRTVYCGIQMCWKKRPLVRPSFLDISKAVNKISFLHFELELLQGAGP